MYTLHLPKLVAAQVHQLSYSTQVSTLTFYFVFLLIIVLLQAHVHGYARCAEDQLQDCHLHHVGSVP